MCTLVKDFLMLIIPLWYIGRYAKRPCLSETNIVYYSYEKQLVSFVYKDKITRTEKTETVSVDEFLKRLIRHIPEKNFRMIRHYLVLC